MSQLETAVFVSNLRAAFTALEASTVHYCLEVFTG